MEAQLNIYDFEDYREFLKNFILLQPKKGRGLIREWSAAIGVHPTLMSHVLQGKKELSFEAADVLATRLQLTEKECDYFFLLVSYAKAGSASLNARFRSKIAAAQRKSLLVSEHLDVKSKITESTQAVFYSNWIYTAVRNLVAIARFNNPEAVSIQLGVSRQSVEDALKFLISKGLCSVESGHFVVGPARTHVAESSPFVKTHHQNWRVKAMERMTADNPSDLFFTFPFSASKEDVLRIRKELPIWLKKISDIVTPSESENVRCLNVDFFDYSRTI